MNSSGFAINRSKILLAAVLIMLTTSTAYASGFAIIENSASGQGNAYAGAAAIAEDASTIYFNPAGMMYLQNDQIVAASHIIVPNADFRNNNSTAAAVLGSPPLSGNNDDGGFDALVPNFYFTRTISEDIKFGLAVNAPFGLAVRYDDTWVGRYNAVETDLKTLNFNPSIAYRMNERLSVGGGINILLADVILTSAVDFGAICVANFSPAFCTGLGADPQMADGFANLTGDNFNSLGFGFNLGLMVELSPSTRVGVAYRSEIDIKVDGDADFTVPSAAAFVITTGAFVDTGLKANVTLPQSLAVSVVQEMNELTLLADITWTGWSSFDELRIVYDNPVQPDSVTTESWEDTRRYSIGANYEYSNNIILRTGIAYDETPVPNAQRRTPRIPGNSRRWISFGATYILDKEFTFDVGYSHLFISDTIINNTFESSIPTLASTVNGTYEASVDILSAQLRWNY